jgi:hypothetical protein
MASRHDRQNETHITGGQAEQDIQKPERQNRIVRTGQAERDRQNSVPRSKSGIFPRSSLSGAG